VTHHLFGIASKRAAYGALIFLTLIWGMNFMAMKFGLQYAHPVIYNIERTWVAIALVFAVLLWERRPLKPESWTAVVVTGFFQTTINTGAITMALAGLVLVVEPWNWQGELAPKLWATLSGFGWAAGTVATKYFQRQRHIDMLNLIAWQMVAGIIPLCLIPLVYPLPPAQWNAVYVSALLYVGVISTGIGFILWTAILAWLPAGTASLNMFAIPVIALVSSMLVFGERLTAAEWLGIASIGAGLAIVSVRAWLASRRGEREVVEAPAIEGG